MSDSFWGPEAAQATMSEETVDENQPQNPPEEPAALAVSADDFAALEERIRRAVELVKRERQERTAAEAHAAELEARVAQVEERAQVQTHAAEKLENELHALRSERDQVRQRVERLLKQLDMLEL